MRLGSGERPAGGLGVGIMALALAAAAFVGATLGLLWQGAGIGEDEAASEQGDAPPTD